MVLTNPTNTNTDMHLPTHPPTPIRNMFCNINMYT